MFWEASEEEPLKIQCCDTNTDNWYTKSFTSVLEFRNFVDAQWRDEPQFYNLRNTKKWKDTGIKYEKTCNTNFEGGRYHDFVPNSLKHKQWKDTEKDRILNGVIYDGIYVPPFYYWYLNYCPIYDAVKKKTRFADVWDGDLWYMTYVMRCILHGKHVGGVKGRQKGYSYKHMAILYWGYCWFQRSVNTVGAFTEDLVKKSWRFLEGYRTHINSNTTWKRGPTLPKSLEWNETQLDESNVPRGLASKLVGVTFKQRPDNDVGGSQTFFNYEEPGVSPTILETIEFIRPALEHGSLTTGIIIACGSVGKLDDAEGIKTIFYGPEDYNFLAVKNVWDKKQQKETSCIFISEAYNMPGGDDDPNDPESTGKPFMDKDGNSDVPLALKWIERKKQQYRNSKKKSELKQLQLSQKCTSPEQAFDERTSPEFPVEKLRRQQERILLKTKENRWEFKPLKGLMEEKEDGKPILNPKPLGGLPQEHEYPINAEWDDKRGVCTMYEPPDPNPEMFTYFASVDAIEVDVTDTSKSIATLDIFKTQVEVSYTDANGKTQKRIEGDKLVFTYRGRFNTADKTNEQIWLGIKLYNAFCYPERNKPNFINYMRRMGRAERYLAKESDVPLFKDLNIKGGSFDNNSKFGFHMGDSKEIWKLFKAQTKEYFSSEYGRTTFENKQGEEEVVKIFTGIDRIDDYWLLEEFIKFVEGKGNYDRLISFMGALFICKVYQQNRIIKRRSEVKKKPEENRYTPPRPISLLGGMRTNTSTRRNKPYSILR